MYEKNLPAKFWDNNIGRYGYKTLINVWTEINVNQADQIWDWSGSFTSPKKESGVYDRVIKTRNGFEFCYDSSWTLSDLTPEINVSCAALHNNEHISVNHRLFAE